MGGEAYLSGWLTGTSRDVLGGWEPSSARTQGAVIAKSLDATEDAAMRRLSAAATPAPKHHPPPSWVQARVDVPVNHLQSAGLPGGVAEWLNAAVSKTVTGR